MSPPPGASDDPSFDAGPGPSAAAGAAASSAAIGAAPGVSTLLVRYGELALKGGNRSLFEKRLVENIQIALRGVTEARVERHQGRLAVTPARRLAAALERLRDVFGISSISPARVVANDFEAIVAAGHAALEEALARDARAGPIPFRVSVKRADKSFPMTSAEVERALADRVLLGRSRLKVRLTAPEMTLGVDLRPEGTFVFAHRERGPGGLPVGTQDRALCLISGGFDSPVAAWLAMKRGSEVAFVTFHSHPYIGEPAKKKVVDLVRVLSRYQRHSALWVVPFADVQLAVRGAGHPGYRTVLYRRMMQRIASRLAGRIEAAALVTGESLGQVASQTIANLTCIEDAATLPVLRPLIAFDKVETIALSRRIGTFDLSSVQEPDCCTLFMPTRPVIRGQVETCRELEARFDVEGLCQAALAGVERIVIDA